MREKSVRQALRSRFRRRGEAGFTLLEMMVAMAILAAFVGVIPRSFIVARQNFDRSEDWLKARLVAETVLAQELNGSELKAGVMDGRIEGRDWSATLDVNGALSSDPGEDRQVLLDVRLRVAISGGESLEVSTMRVGRLE